MFVADGMCKLGELTVVIQSEGEAFRTGYHSRLLSHPYWSTISDLSCVKKLFESGDYMSFLIQIVSLFTGIYDGVSSIPSRGCIVWARPVASRSSQSPV
jgi:hypothetical protein